MVEARAEALARLAEPDARLGAAAGGLVAAVCGFDVPYWRNQAGQALALDEALMARLGLPDGGEILYDGASAEVRVSWPAAEPYPGEVASVELEVVRAGETYTLRVTPAEEGGRAATLRAAVSVCAEVAEMSLSGDMPDEAELRMPFGEGEARWPREGEGLPEAGELRWKLEGEGVVVTEDASTSDGLTWPAEASAQDWTWAVELDVGR